ncbi:discoidin domain-containing protein [Streptacidiphilus sp. P02-A3a]|uniref:discoidin domain-containing protein n=1 Tax=Streptacidiphilus sp. P02-A3a TaxID=2704468 RepID=UPI0015F9233E|nr:discoidin domain-containing protein [Streptacidiphilus sp. P02-A3a]QMU68687.1 discoidin domain-containing protein [Streptacidiphilus sp. P02-A3a]
MRILEERQWPQPIPVVDQSGFFHTRDPPNLSQSRSHFAACGTKIRPSELRLHLKSYAGTYTFVIDLGSNKTINEIDSDWFQALSDDVFLPASVTYSVSSDDSSFTQVASITEPYVSADMQAKTYRAIALNTAGRYVKVTVDGGTAWSMVDEVAVMGQ